MAFLQLWIVRKVITFHFSSLLHKNGFRHTQIFASRQIQLCDSLVESHKWNINFYFFSSSFIIIININNKASTLTCMHEKIVFIINDDCEWKHVCAYRNPPLKKEKKRTKQKWEEEKIFFEAEKEGCWCGSRHNKKKICGLNNQHISFWRNYFFDAFLSLLKCNHLPYNLRVKNWWKSIKLMRIAGNKASFWAWNSSFFSHYSDRWWQFILW